MNVSSYAGALGYAVWRVLERASVTRQYWGEADSLSRSIGRYR